MNRIFLYIISTVFILMIGYIAFQQYSFYHQLSNIQKDLNNTQKQLSDYKDQNYKSQQEIFNSIQQSNDKLSNDLEKNLNEIKSIRNDNDAIADKLQYTVNNIATNTNKYSKATTDEYLKRTTVLFNESTRLLKEIASGADEANQTALTYHKMLEEQYKIVQEYNIKMNKK